MLKGYRRWAAIAWLALICGFAVLHAIHLSADFPNHSPWYGDWAKYTDEGWYGNAAIRAHLFGHWYLPGDFNPAPAVPVWPALEWLLFFLTGVSVEAARGLAVAFFFVSLLLSYLLLRTSVPRWAALLALTLLVSSPFLYCFSRLAILEPMLITLTLAALVLAVHLPRLKRPVLASAAIGLLFTLMMLTKTTAVFLLPALGWAMLQPLRGKSEVNPASPGDDPWGWPMAARCALAAAITAAVSFGLWMALVVWSGHLPDYNYLFYINTYPKPANHTWPLVSLWWSIHGGLWVDHILIPLAGVVASGALLAWRTAWGRSLVADPVFGASVLVVVGYILFMTVQYHPQPRYFAVVAFFCFFLVAQGAVVLMHAGGTLRQFGWGIVVLAASAAVANGAWTLSYAAHPEYTFVSAARGLVQYMDQHPNRKRLLLSTSGDEITLLAHVPAICDDFGTPSRTYPDLTIKLERYQPGWFASWNDLDPGTLADIHTHFSLEQVASFHAFDDPERNVLVLFKLHPLPHWKVRDQHDESLRDVMPEDRISIPVE
ncbi:MAG TPA: glycosyltransferase family 39 protein [Terracidiphilus sp.]|nr:glycosyltransferase family 39 protein [Terracidiphilus sp.]